MQFIPYKVFKKPSDFYNIKIIILYDCTLQRQLMLSCMNGIMLLATHESYKKFNKVGSQRFGACAIFISGKLAMTFWCWVVLFETPCITNNGHPSFEMFALKTLLFNHSVSYWIKPFNWLTVINMAFVPFKLMQEISLTLQKQTFQQPV